MKITKIKRDKNNNPIRIAYRLSRHRPEQWTTAGLGALRAIRKSVPINTPNRTKRIMSLVQDAE
jgi:hypothetical protein